MRPPIIRTPFLETYYGKGRRKQERTGFKVSLIRSGADQNAPGGPVVGICIGWSRSYYLIMSPWRIK